ncbi:hypothetical protein P278_15330 [Zhouia amylolytica AD3]|uniref:Uncharacterized protein n=1 Tax=Zhouia amylolytica AD3 TaxID=1286632 RepID=W2UQR3_9FLAO|nr:hypothetical protein P278_15330 [Zhouia amylolytica AD3]
MKTKIIRSTSQTKPNSSANQHQNPPTHYPNITPTLSYQKSLTI